VPDNALMDTADLTETEQLVYQKFRTGDEADLSEQSNKTVRAEVIRFLLLGGVPAEPGNRPGLRLVGAHVTGMLEVDYADVTVPVYMRWCDFDEPVVLFASHLRRLSLVGSTMPGLLASMATLDATLGLSNIVSTGAVGLLGTRVGGSLLIDGARLMSARAAREAGLVPASYFDAGLDVALQARALHIGVDLVAGAVVCRGAVRLDNAEIIGSMRRRWAPGCPSRAPRSPVPATPRSTAGT
jgi:hypothetical protein